jgi:hypothetical protein
MSGSGGLRTRTAAGHTPVDSCLSCSCLMASDNQLPLYREPSSVKMASSAATPRADLCSFAPHVVSSIFFCRTEALQPPRSRGGGCAARSRRSYPARPGSILWSSSYASVTDPCYAGRATGGEEYVSVPVRAASRARIDTIIVRVVPRSFYIESKQV